MLLPKRTTIDINDVLFRAAKRRAAERGSIQPGVDLTDRKRCST